MKKLLLNIIAILFATNIFAQVSFNADVTSGCAPLTVNFTNTSSIGVIFEWFWNDGTLNFYGFDTSHTFTQKGPHWVELHAYDSIGNSVGNYGMTISINGYGQINTSTDTACLGENITFYLGEDVSSYDWDFGDGNTASGGGGSDFQHSYSSAGSYLVQVIFSLNECPGTDTLYKTIVVTNSAVPNANFWFNNPTCPGDEIDFSPQNENAASYKWYFGDGDSSGATSPHHTYDSVGNYPVTLIITNICGNTNMRTDTARISNSVYFGNYINFEVNNDNSNVLSVCPNDPVTFRREFNEPKEMIWYFGDGDSSLADEPIHTYAVADTYTVSVWVNNGCDNDTTITKTLIVGNNLLFSNPGINAMSSPSCPNDNIFFQASSAVSYQWDFGDGITSTDATPAHSYSAIDTYTVTVNMTNGCGNDTTVSTQVVVTNGIFPTLSNDNWGTPNESAICPGDSTIFYSFGAASYLWDFGDGTSTTLTTPIDVNGIIADIAKHAYTSLGTFSVKLTYTNGCGNSVMDSLTVTVDSTAGADVNGGMAPFSSPYATCETVDFFAFGGATYKWYFGDGDSATTTAGNVSHTYNTSGSYNISVVVTNSCFKTATYSDNIQVNDMTAVISSTDNLCSGENNGAINLIVGGGVTPFTFLWSNGASSQNLSNLANGTYSVTITDDNGCSITASQSITSPTALNLTMNVTNSTCSSSNGQASVSVSGGTSPYNYSWSTSSTNDSIFSLIAGNYTVTITDNKGCMMTKVASVNDITAPTLSSTSTDVDCNGGNNGTAMVTASGYVGTKYTVTVNSSNFSPNSLNVNVGDTIMWVLGSGNHTTTSTSVPSGAATWDSPINGTTTSFTYVVSVIGTYNYKCTPHGFTGSFTAFSPYTYLWSNFSTNDSISNLSAGIYSVTVTGAGGCVAAASVTVNEPSAIFLSTTSMNVNCNGGNDGSINLSVNGGTAGYTYMWSNSATTEDLSNLTANSYSVTVTDNNNCTATLSDTITEPNALTLTPSSTTSNCGSATGTASVSVSGGTPSYSYSWSSGGSSSSIFNVAAGSYIVTVTDANGCSQSTTINVSNTGAPTLTSISTDATCNGYQDGAINLTISGGATPYNFSWSNLDTSKNISSLAAGIYTVTVTDNNNCVAILSDTVNEPVALAPDFTVSGNVLTCSNAAVNYQWLLNDTVIVGATNQSYTISQTGNYSVIISDVNCSDTSTKKTVVFVGVTELLNVNSLQIYPNPSDGNFIIEGKMNSKENLQISIINILGKEILNLQIQNVNRIFKKQISLNEMTDGIYFLRMKTGQQSIVRKIVKQD